MKLVDYLNQVYEDRCRSNPSYSLRAFARALDIDSSTLSAILRGKRSITVKTARKLIDGLKIMDPVEAQMLIVETVTGEEFQPEKLIYDELVIEKAEAISDWQHFAILGFLELTNSRGGEKEISRRLKIPLHEVQGCCERLERLGLIGNAKGKWKLTGSNVATSSPVPNVALQKGHRQNILKAIDSLSEDSVDSRDISGITMAISKNKIPKAKKLIQDFRRRMSAYLETGVKDEVYRLNIQLFPLTKDNS